MTTLQASNESHLQFGISVVPYDASQHKEQWDAFVKRSMNGTKFHLQQFLDYHPEGKFNFHHLLFFDGARLIAVLPGGFTKGKNGERHYDSPLGASYGSFVVEDISAETALALVRAFEEYIKSVGVAEVFLTGAPVVYQPVLTQNLDFALLYAGYHYSRHYISHIAELPSDRDVASLLHPVAQRYIRRAFKKYPGLTVEEITRENFAAAAEEFYPIMLSNKAKHNTTPTHSLDDLRKLHALLPDLMKLWLVRLDGELIAGSLIFLANDRVALSFYPMLKYEHSDVRAIYVVSEVMMQWSKDNGYSFFDFGVSQDTNDENPMTPALSLIQFKEKFGSRGVLRSTLSKRYSV